MCIYVNNVGLPVYLLACLLVSTLIVSVASSVLEQDATEMQNSLISAGDGP